MINPTFPAALPYLATPKDFEELAAMGYILKRSPEEACAFVNKHFANLDILSWYREIEDLFKDIAMPPVHREIKFEEKDSDASIRIIFADKDYESDTDGLILVRDLIRNGTEIEVYHKLLRLPQVARGKGLSKKIFRVSIPQYINMKTVHIRVETGLTDGGLVWTLYDFRATEKDDMELILRKAQLMLTGTQFAIVKRIFDDYYALYKSGDRFPILYWGKLKFMQNVLKGATWKGILDFRNQEQMTNFIFYVNQGS